MKKHLPVAIAILVYGSLGCHTQKPPVTPEESPITMLVKLQAKRALLSDELGFNAAIALLSNLDPMRPVPVAHIVPMIRGMEVSMPKLAELESRVAKLETKTRERHQPLSTDELHELLALAPEIVDVMSRPALVSYFEQTHSISRSSIGSAGQGGEPPPKPSGDPTGRPRPAPGEQEFVDAILNRESSYGQEYFPARELMRAVEDVYRGDMAALNHVLVRVRYVLLLALVSAASVQESVARPEEHSYVITIGVAASVDSPVMMSLGGKAALAHCSGDTSAPAWRTAKVVSVDGVPVSEGDFVVVPNGQYRVIDLFMKAHSDDGDKRCGRILIDKVDGRGKGHEDMGMFRLASEEIVQYKAMAGLAPKSVVSIMVEAGQRLESLPPHIR